MVLNCIFLMTNDIKHFFPLCLFIVCISSLVKFLFFFKKNYYDWFTKFCQLVFVQQNDPVIWTGHMNIYICSFSHIILHHVSLQMTRYIVPLLYSRISLPVHSKCKSFHLLTTDFGDVSNNLSIFLLDCFH